MSRLVVVPAILLFGLLLLPGRGEAGYFRHSNGYYYDSYGHGYSRWFQPGYHNGYSYQPSYYYYQRDYSAPAYAPSAPQPPVYSPDWRTEALKVAKQRDDLAAFQQTLAALGYKAVPVAVGAYSGYSTFGAQGGTVYGYPSYSLKTIQETYGGLDLNQGFASAARLAQNAQSLSGDAVKDLNAILAAAGNNSARVASILAEGAARQRIADSTRLSSSSRTETTITGTGAAPAAMPPADAPKASGEFLKTLGEPKCGKCHSGGTVKGGFKISDFTPAAAKDLKDKVYARILSDDPKATMPPPGEPQLTAAELKKFLTQ